MDNLGPINNLIDDCIFEIWKWLNSASILLFGATNRRFQALVSRRINEIQNHQTIHFALERLPLTQAREILERFGQHIFHLTIHFGLRVIDMDLFQDHDGCLVQHIRNLHLETSFYSNRNDEMDGFFPPEPMFDQITRLINGFRSSSENIIDSINNSDMPLLRNLTFTCSFIIEWDNYLFFHESLDELVNPVLIGLFLRLRRGNMMYTRINTHDIDLVLEFNLP